MRCADGTLLAAWVDGELDAVHERAVAEHSERCRRCAERAQQQRLVKWRTAHLSAEGTVAPRSDLLDQLLTVPTREHTRQSQARRSCGTVSPGWAGIAVGAGVGVSMATVAWLAPMSANGPVPTGARVDAPRSVVPLTSPVTSPVTSPTSPSPAAVSSTGVSPSPAPGSVPFGATDAQQTGLRLAVLRHAGDAG